MAEEMDKLEFSYSKLVRYHMESLSLTVVKSPEQPAGSHPPPALSLVSYRGASTVTVVTAPALKLAPIEGTGRITSTPESAVSANIYVPLLISFYIFRPTPDV